MEIYVCIGSSCHLKGSYNIINAFKELIAEYKLEDQVSLNASFCLGHCQHGSDDQGERRDRHRAQHRQRPGNFH